MADIYENLDSIFEKRRNRNQGILDEYKKTGYGKDAAMDLPGIIGNVVKGGGGVAKAIMSGGTAGWDDVASGVGGVIDSASREKTVNNFTGESVVDKPKTAWSDLARSINSSAPGGQSLFGGQNPSGDQAGGGQGGGQGLASIFELFKNMKFK